MGKFSLAKQFEGSGNLVSEFYQPGITIPETSSVGSTDYFGGATKAKEGPTSLAEDINNPAWKSGATIMVIDRNNGDQIKYITNKFFLRSMNFNSQEKAQLLETFDVPNVSFFGQRIKVYQFSGNTIEHPSTETPYKTMQHSSLMQLYEKHLRATKLVENNHMGVLKINNHLVYGYPIQLASSYTSGADKIVSFNLSWVVAEHTWTLSGVGNEKELASLYDGTFEENQIRREYLNNIASILGPVSNLFSVSYKNDDGETEFVNPLNVTNMSYQTFMDSNEQVIDEFIDRTVAALNAIKTTRVQSSDVASVLIEFSQGRVDYITNIANNIKSSWEDFQKFQQVILSLHSLKRKLENFKFQLTVVSNG